MYAYIDENMDCITVQLDEPVQAVSLEAMVECIAYSMIDFVFCDETYFGNSYACFCVGFYYKGEYHEAYVTLDERDELLRTGETNIFIA